MALLEMQAAKVASADELHQEMSVSIESIKYAEVESPESSPRSKKNHVEHVPISLCLRAIPAIRSSAATTGPIRSTASSTQEPYCWQMEIPCCLCRVEDRSGLSHLCAARSANGIDGWRIDPQPTLMANPKEYPEEIWGIEDPRITYVPELEQYAVAYTSFARGGPGVSLALTKDFKSFERYGVIMSPEDKDAALLPAGLAAAGL
jgi:hypothetical protein